MYSNAHLNLGRFHQHIINLWSFSWKLLIIVKNLNYHKNFFSHFLSNDHYSSSKIDINFTAFSTINFYHWSYSVLTSTITLHVFVINIESLRIFENSINLNVYCHVGMLLISTVFKYHGINICPACRFSYLVKSSGTLVWQILLIY